jgi:hypothetical protein
MQQLTTISRTMTKAKRVKSAADGTSIPSGLGRHPSSSQNDEQAAATSFLSFSRLPVELRYMVYNLSFKPQMVSLRKGGGPRQPISAVCKEVREYYFKYYFKYYRFLKKRASEMRPAAGLFINPKIDILNVYIPESIRGKGYYLTKCTNHSCLPDASTRFVPAKLRESHSLYHTDSIA